MRLLAAVYGFEVTRTILCGTWRIEPVTDSYLEARRLARDLEAYHLTATIVGECLPEEDRFKLEAVLCFIEHLDVIVLSTEQLVENDQVLESQFPPTLLWQHRNNGGGAVLGSDAFSHQSRSDFLNRAMSTLADDAFCSSTKFHTLLFKCVETFRQRRPFLEITYFLLFSGLESFARATLGDTSTRNASKPIYKLLTAYGFDVLLNEPTDLPRSIATYTRLRNSLFHNSEFEASVRINGAHVKLNVSSYVFHLSMLVSLTILKAVGFDDGHTHWDAWIDRQLHC